MSNTVSWEDPDSTQANNNVKHVGAVYLIDPSTLKAISPAAGAGGNSGVVEIGDGVTPSLKATVGPFHNSDNQVLTNIANALVSAGVAQILNPAGTADRQRGTGADGVPAVGIPSGSQQLAGPALTTTFNGAVTGNTNSQTITVASTANMKVGDIITTSDNVESGEVISVLTGTTFTIVLKNNHGNGTTLTWFHFNQARDATTGDQQPLTGIGASQTYLWNSITNLGELERSAASELDGGKGFGFNAAVGQEFNGGGPVLATGLLSGYNYDRERNLQAKSVQTATITSTLIGDTVLKFASAAATNTVQPGTPILLAAGTWTIPANQKEIVYVSASWTPGSAANIPLQSPVVNASSTTAVWEVYNFSGPGLNAFTAVGVGIEEEALFDPVTQAYYIERAATQDGVVPQNVVMETPALWNGTTMDRQRGNLDNITILASGAVSANATSADQTNYNGRGIKLFVNTGAFGAGFSAITVTIQGKDPVSGQYYTILTSASLTASSFQPVLSVYPGLTASANVTANDVLPRTWRVSWNATAWGTGGSTLGIGAAIIV